MPGMVSAKPVRTGPLLDGYRVIREGLTGDETDHRQRADAAPGPAPR